MTVFYKSRHSTNKTRLKLEWSTIKIHSNNTNKTFEEDDRELPTKMMLNQYFINLLFKFNLFMIKNHYQIV
jgi:hypothetical protein